MYLRILAEKKKGYWLATCLELNIMAMGKSPEEAVCSLQDAIYGHIKAVLKTDDKLSIPRLLNRPAPLSKRAMFYIAHKIHLFKKWKTSFLEEGIGHHCNISHA